MKTLLSVFISILSLSSLLSTAQGAVSLDEEIRQILDEYGGVGLTAWSVDGEANFCSLGAAGERIKGSGEQFVVNGDSRHHVGSVTKSMTATLLAILMEDGIIPSGWNTTLEQVLPAAAGTAYENVTLRQLAGMLSGLRGNPTAEDVPDLDITADIRTQRQVVAEGALRSTPAHTPGSAFLYSNWGYMLAGHIIEVLTDATWEEVLAERLFLPLGIDLGDDFTGPPNNKVDPWGHSGEEQTPCNPSTMLCDNYPVLGPAGTFSGPVAAMAVYLSWHVQCHNGNSSIPLLSQESCQELHQPADATINDYGHGWVCKTQNEQQGFTCVHDGSNSFNYYLALLLFDMDRVAVTFTNGLRLDNAEEDGQMILGALNATLSASQECDSRIPSTYYLNSTFGPTLNVSHGGGGDTSASRLRLTASWLWFSALLGVMSATLAL